MSSPSMVAVVEVKFTAREGSRSGGGVVQGRRESLTTILVRELGPEAVRRGLSASRASVGRGTRDA